MSAGTGLAQSRTTWQRLRGAVPPLGVVAIALTVATLIRFALHPWLGSAYTLVTYFPVVLLTAFYFRWQLALVAIVASAILSVTLFIGPESFTRAQFLALVAVYLPTQSLMVWLVARLREMLTRAQRLERQARDGSARQAMMLEAAQVDLWEWDAGSDRFLLGGGEPAQPGEAQWLSSAEFFDRIEPADRERVRDELARAPETMQFECEYRIRPPAGPRTVLVKARLERDDTGSLNRLVGVAIDRTSRQQAQAAVKASEDRCALALEAMQGHVYEVDVASGIVERSPGLLALVGLSEADALPKVDWWTERILPEDRPRLKVAPGPVPDDAAGRRLSAQYRVQHRNGHYIWVEEHCRIDYAPDGTARRIVGCTFSIDDRKKAEAALVRRADQQALLLELTRQIAETDLEERLLLERLYEQLHRRLSIDAGFCYRFNVAAGQLELQVAMGVQEPDRKRAAILPLGEAFCGTAAETCAPVIADEARIDSDPRGALVRSMGIRAYACQPIFARSGELLGTFSVATRRKACFDADEIALLQTITYSLGLAWQRRAATRELLEGRQRLQLALDSSAAGLYVWDIANDVLEWDARVRDIWGTGADERTAFDEFRRGWHPDDAPQVEAALRQALDPAGAGRLELEYRVVRRADGRTCWVAGTGLVSFADARPVRLVGTILDVTARRDALARLEESETRRTIAMRVGRLASWEADVVSLRNIWDEQMYALLGIEGANRAELAAHWEEAIHPEDFPRVRRALREAMDGRGDFRVEFRIRRFDDGSERWLASVGSAVRGPSGKVERIVGVLQDITERQDAEAEIRRTTRLLQAVGEHTSQAIYVKDLELRLLFANPSAVRFLHAAAAAADQLLGKTNEEILRDPEQARAMTISDRNVIETGVEETIEETLHGHEGTRYLLSTKTPLRDEQGRIVGLVGISHDITGRKLAERALIESEERLRLALDASAIGIWSWDAESGSVIWSTKCYEIFGRTPEQFGGTHADFVKLVHPEDRAGRMAEFHAGVASNQPYSSEFRILLPNGEIRWVANRATVRFDPSGRVLGMLGTVRDITDRKRWESELHASEMHARQQSAELEALYAAAPIGLCVLDTDLRYQRINARLAEINGLPVEAHLGRTVREVVPDLAETAIATMQRVLQGESVFNIEFVGTTPAQPGVVRTWRENWLPFRDPAGEIVGITISAEEVTQAKAAEEALKEASRQKDEFLAMLAHELRNPLAPVRTATALLSKTLGDEPRARQPLGILERQTQQLARLVDDLLDVSRIAQGRIVLQHEVLDVNAIVDQAVETVQPLIVEKSQRVRITRPRSRLYVKGDRARLVQCVANILHNAAKYTDAGGELAVELAESPASQVTIEVRDNGQGINAELLPRVFDLFVQSERTLDRSEGGLGIGLSVVKRLMQMHGGEVAAHSDGVGRGSTFTLRLPQADAPSLAPRENATDRAPPRRVLVVDDNVDSADSLALLLKLDGHEAQAIYSAHDALHSAAKFDADVVLLDIGLPQMSGYEVAQRLRATLWRPGVMLVALTGYGQREDRERALAAGFDDHLVKPADPDALQAILKRAVADRDSRLH